MIEIKPHKHKCTKCGKEWICDRPNMCEDIGADTRKCPNPEIDCCGTPCLHAQEVCAQTKQSICDDCIAEIEHP